MEEEEKGMLKLLKFMFYFLIGARACEWKEHVFAEQRQRALPVTIAYKAKAMPDLKYCWMYKSQDANEYWISNKEQACLRAVAKGFGRRRPARQGMLKFKCIFTCVIRCN